MEHNPSFGFMIIYDEPDSVFSLHVLASFLRVLLDGFTFFQLTGCIADFGEGLTEFLGRSLLSVILDGDGLVLHAGLDALDAFLKTEIALDFVLAVHTVHLWGSGEDHSLDVFGKARHGCEQGEGECRNS